MLFDAIRDATPVTSISGYRRTENQLRHFDRLLYNGAVSRDGRAIGGKQRDLRRRDGLQ